MAKKNGERPDDFYYPNEQARLAELLSLGLLEDEKETGLNVITQLASDIFDMPMVFISFMEHHRQWFKASIGFPYKEINREFSFCNYTLLDNEPITEVNDTRLDERFKNNPLVNTEPAIVFYAGLKLLGPNGYPVGTFCLLDKKPRRLTDAEKSLFTKLGNTAQNELLKSNFFKSLLPEEITKEKEFVKLYFDENMMVPNGKLLDKFYKHEMVYNNIDNNIFIVAIEVNVRNKKDKDSLDKLLKKMVFTIQSLNKFKGIFGVINNNIIIGIINLLDRSISEKKITEIIQGHAHKMMDKLEFIEHNLSFFVTKASFIKNSFYDNLLGLNISRDILADNPEISFYSEDMRQQREREELIENYLSLAINQKIIKPYIQPKIAIDDDNKETIKGGEILLRWHDAIVGNISPLEFIPIAEKTGLIKKIGYLLLEELIKIDKKIAAKNLMFKPEISINLSIKQLNDDLLFIEDLVDVYVNNISSLKLCVEITESTYAENFELIRETHGLLNPHHIKLSLDDFGTGYSSLMYISSRCFDEIKIDRIFVDGMDDFVNQLLIKTVIDFSRVLDIEVIAEGVSLKKQVNKLLQLGCINFQGFYFFQPMPVNNFVNLLR